MISLEKSVGAVIFRRNNKNIKYLLLNYGQTKKGNYYWGFAKGHTERGETEEETMRREIFEETGISDLKIITGFSYKDRYLYRAYGEEKEERRKSGRKTLIAKQVIYLLAETATENVKISEEHIEFEWLPYEEALKKLTFKSSKKVLEKAKKFIDKIL